MKELSMKLLLVNKNPVVARMMLMSVPKAGFEIEEVDNVHNLPSGEYDVVVIDDEMYDDNFLHDINQNIKYYQLGLIASSKNTHSDQFDFILSKPFLPTDLIEILRDVKNKIEFKKKQEQLSQPRVAKDPNLQPSNKDTFASLVNSSQARESIVEVEEHQEESPFIQEKFEKSGVLDEKDLQKVNSLLKEESTGEILEAPPIKLKEDEEEDFFKEKIEPVVSAKATPKKEEAPPIQPLDPLLSDGLEERELDIEEAKSQSLLDDIIEIKEEPKEPLLKIKTETPEPQPIKLEPSEPSPEAKEEPLKEPEPPKEPLIGKQPLVDKPSLEDFVETVKKPKKVEQKIELDENSLKPTIEPLGVDELRKLLDGMQLDITIKISFPGKKDD